MAASPNVITLTGSSTQISKIKEVVLMVDVGGISKDSQATGIPVIYDINGEVVNSSKVSMSATEVAVTIPVLKTKAVKIMVYTTGEPATGYEVDTILYQPDMVTVAGTPGELVLMGSVLSAYCDVTNKSGVVEENIDIASLWNENLETLRLVDEDKLAVTITFKEYEQKVFELNPNAIEIRGMSDNLQYKIANLAFTQVHVSGKEASLKDINLQKLAPYIDVSSLTMPGSYMRTITLENLGDLILHDVLLAEVEITYPLQPDDPENPEAGIPVIGEPVTEGETENETGTVTEQ